MERFYGDLKLIQTLNVVLKIAKATLVSCQTILMMNNKDKFVF